MKQGIIIQGPTEYYKELADHYSQFENVVWATWNDESVVHLDYISSKSIQIILLEKPKFPGYMNVNMQLASSYAGVNRLFELGVEEALKVRSDTIVTNLDKLLPRLQGKQLAFAATCKTGVRKDIAYDLVYYHNSHDYPADNVIYGKVEDLLLMFDFQIDEMLAIPPESLITWNYMVSTGMVFHLSYKNMINEGISFFLQDCLDKNVEINWLKRGVNLVDWYKDKTVYEW
jgi:hypothetical protein